MAEIISTREEAEARAERIRGAFSVAFEEVATAYNQNDHIALGYRTWDQYCAGELDGRVALPRIKGDRVSLVKALSGAGMSQRAIAAATDMSRNTVAKYINPEVAQIEPPKAGVESAASAGELAEKVKTEKAGLDAALQEIGYAAGAGNSVADVMCDPWIIRAIQVESLTPVEVLESVLRRQTGQPPTTDDEHGIDLLVTGLLTRTGRWINAFNPDIPLTDIYQKED